MSALELDGYLTGVIAAPSVIPPMRWMGALWDSGEMVFDDDAQALSTMDAVGSRYRLISARIGRSLRRLEDEGVCDYRPAFMPVEGKPSHETVRAWVGGFWKAMKLAPNAWRELLSDESTQLIFAPFVPFTDLGFELGLETPANGETVFDESAESIPCSILLLRKVQDILRTNSKRRVKVGRNDPCPCGSGRKAKRCCGTD